MRPGKRFGLSAIEKREPQRPRHFITSGVIEEIRAPSEAESMRANIAFQSTQPQSVSA